MSKLPSANRFIDLSDYARPVAVRIVEALRPTPVSSIQLTFAFFLAGLAGIACIASGHYALAALALMLKNVLDAADGEMARVRERPSHSGRFLDSIFDFAINLGIVAALYVEVATSLALAAFVFVSIEFQGTIFNFYYLHQRRLLGGDTTSSVNEFDPPDPFAYESARVVSILHKFYVLCYGVFDQLMLAIEGERTIKEPLPNWYMTLVSTMGLGFQLLIISLALLLGLVDFVLPLLLLSGGLGLLIILIRKYMRLGEKETASVRAKCPESVE